MKNRISDGITVKYKNAGVSTINSGDMIQYSANLGIACVDIEPGKTGSVDIEGVFLLPKEAEEFEPGQDLYVNVSTKKLTATPTAWYAGLCVESETSPDTATQCLLKIGY